MSKNIKLGNFKMWTDDAQLLLLDFIKSIKNNKNLLKTNKDHLNSLSIVDSVIVNAVDNTPQFDSVVSADRSIVQPV